MSTADPQKPTANVVEGAAPATPLRAVKTEQTGAAPGHSVRPARLRPRHVIALASFVLMVVAPITVTFFYLYTVAADQYASRAAFSIRKEESNPAVSILGGLNLSSSSTSDADVLYQYIQSQNIVEELEERLDLRAMFTGPHDTDPVFALAPDASREDLVTFWNRMVTARLDPGSGIIELEARAFSPEDANALTTAILEQSSGLVDELSQIAQDDTLRYAREEVETATQRLKDTRVEIGQLRRSSRIIDPNADFQSQMGVLTQLEQQLADALIELELLEGQGTPNDPRIPQARRKIDAIRNRIEDERASVVAQGENPERNQLYATLGQYEALLVDQEFAEQAYVAALANYDSALADARRKSRYLATHVRPTMAQTAEYPRRLTTGAVLSVFIFLAWVLLLLVGYSLRDRR